ncbi:hypothetical protein NDU88_003254 [Pleurodeles waltl]|uniref:Uncharacterized protein n=1 Tax=Pleurodeles waltl TaxID=8319 RepID=A0AAV7SE93_PLEWA|nr:hypothetical protein NDU88_003254 [Pleurodeles waltl]
MGLVALWSSADRAPRQAKACLFPPAWRELGGSDRPSLPPNDGPAFCSWAQSHYAVALTGRLQRRGSGAEVTGRHFLPIPWACIFFVCPVALCISAYRAHPARRELGGSDRPSLPPITLLGCNFLKGPGPSRSDGAARK